MGLLGKVAARGKRVGSWFGASGLLVRVDEHRIEGSFLDRSAADAGDDGASTSRSGWRIQRGIAAALVVMLAVVAFVAIRAADRTNKDHLRVAAARYAHVKIGMSAAQVLRMFGRRPEGIETTKDAAVPGLLEKCWIYYQGDAPQYQVCFQHGRVTRKQAVRP